MVKRSFAILLAACMVLCILPMQSAFGQPDNASLEIRARNQNGEVRDHIMDDESLHYTVTARQGTLPAQEEDLLIEILDKNYDLVYSEIRTTDALGEASDTVHQNELPTLGTYIFYANYSGTNLLTDTFTVYSPVPFEFSTIATYSDGGAAISYFSETDTVYYEIYVRDQYDEPFNPNNVNFNFYHLDDEIFMNWWDYDTDATDGSIIGDFRPANYLSSSEIYGDYQINLTYNGDMVVNFTFQVTHINVILNPDRAIYTQGETIMIIVKTDFTSPFLVNITNNRGYQYLDAAWTATPIGGNWSANYTLQDDMEDGWYHINVMRDGHLLRRESFQVKKYTLEISPNKDGFLPGETMSTLYTITSNIDGGPSAASLEWIFSYRNAAYQRQTKTNSLATPTSSGTLQIEIPTDISTQASHDPVFMVWANDTTDHTASDRFDVDIGHIGATITLLNGQEFLAGQFVQIRVVANVAGAPVSGAKVKITLEQGNQNISVKQALETDEAGVCSYILPIPASLEVGTYIIRVNVTSSVNNKETTEPIEDIDIVDQIPLTIHIRFDKTEYYPGELVTVTYSTLRNGEPSNTNIVYKIIKNSVFGDVIATGHTNQGEFQFSAPAEFKGQIWVVISAYTDAGEEYAASDYTVVNFGHILVNANRDHYLPGDSVSFSYVLMNIESTLDLYYEVIGGGQVIARNQLERSTFSLKVPQENPPEEYTVNVFGYMDGNVVTGSETVYLKKYYLTLEFDEKSYKPGDTIKVHYKIVPVGNNPDMDSPFMLSYGIDQSEQLTIWTDDASGDISYPIPVYLPDGDYIFTTTGSFAGGESNTEQVFEAVHVQEGINGQAVFNAIVVILLLLALLMGFAAMQGKSLADILKRPTKRSFYSPPKEWSAPETETTDESLGGLGDGTGGEEAFPMDVDSDSEPPFPDDELDMDVEEVPEPKMPGEHSSEELKFPETSDEGDDLL
jgi:hypothetical protein